MLVKIETKRKALKEVRNMKAESGGKVGAMIEKEIDVAREQKFLGKTSKNKFHGRHCH